MKGIFRILLNNPVYLSNLEYPVLFLIALALMLLAACTSASPPTATPTQPTTAVTSQATRAPTQAPAQPAAKPTLYVPPSAAPDVTLAVVNPSPSPSPDAALTALPEPFSPTVTPVCSSDLKFLEDLTIPDGTQVAPGELIDKRWKVENSGTCNWDERFTLRLFSGESLGAMEVQALFPARSGSQAVIRILFTAPDEPGSYQSAWKAYDPEGVEFGMPIFMQIVVREE